MRMRVRRASMPRNKSDELIEAVAKTGGTIGASIYGADVLGRRSEPSSRLENFFEHSINMACSCCKEHVAFGTDLPAVKDMGTAEHILKMTRTRFPENVAAYEVAFGGSARARYIFRTAARRLISCS